MNRFPEYVDDVVSMMSAQGVAMQVHGRVQALRATPQATGEPDVWLLGSSDFSARLAAARGLPYVFAHHFSGNGTAEALELYRSGYQPSERHPGARTFLTVNAVVAETAEEARRRALPNILTMVALRTGAPLGPQPTIEDAEERGVPEVHRPLAEQMTSRWVLGTPDEAAAQLTALATTYGVDEVMLNPVAGATRDAPRDRAPNREETLRLLVERPLTDRSGRAVVAVEDGDPRAAVGAGLPVLTDAVGLRGPGDPLGYDDRRVGARRHPFQHHRPVDEHADRRASARHRWSPARSGASDPAWRRRS